MTLKRYEHGSTEYAAALELRTRVLRGPLGLVYNDEDLAREVTDIHIGAFEGDAVLGTLILTPAGDAVKMRQVAVAPDHQGEGIGRLLVEFSETVARNLGFTEMVLHARDTAVPFYERLGYATNGDVFIEVTIPHRAMKKAL